MPPPLVPGANSRHRLQRSPPLTYLSPSAMLSQSKPSIVNLSSQLDITRSSYFRLNGGLRAVSGLGTLLILTLSARFLTSSSSGLAIEVRGCLVPGLVSISVQLNKTCSEWSAGVYLFLAAFAADDCIILYKLIYPSNFSKECQQQKIIK